MGEKCQAFTRRGRACQAWAGKSGFCFFHDPDRRQAAQAARRKGRLRRAPGPAPVLGRLGIRLPRAIGELVRAYAGQVGAHGA